MPPGERRRVPGAHQTSLLCLSLPLPLPALASQSRTRPPPCRCPFRPLLFSAPPTLDQNPPARPSRPPRHPPHSLTRPTPEASLLSTASAGHPPRAHREAFRSIGRSSRRRPRYRPRHAPRRHMLRRASRRRRRARHHNTVLPRRRQHGRLVHRARGLAVWGRAPPDGGYQEHVGRVPRLGGGHPASRCSLLLGRLQRVPPRGVPAA